MDQELTAPTREELATLLDETEGVPSALAEAIRRAAAEVVSPSDIVVAKFDSSL